MFERLRCLRAKLAIPGAVVLAGIGLLVWEPVGVRVLRNLTFDQFQRLQPRGEHGAPVRIIDIDDASIERLGQWPWPRARIAQLTIALQQARPRAIAYDFLWSEPERGQSPGAPPAAQNAPSAGDLALAESIGRGHVVLGFALQRETAWRSAPMYAAHGVSAHDSPSRTAGSPADRPAPFSRVHYVTAGASPLPFLQDFDRAVDALPLLTAAADGYGALNFVADTDGVIRRVPLLVRRGEVMLPTLVAEALRVADGAVNYTVRTTMQAGVTDISIGRRRILTTENAEIWIHYATARASRSIPAWAVLAGLVPTGQLQDQILLVGTSAQGLMDVRFNPLGGVMPGVEVHAQMLEQILDGTALNRPGWVTAAEALAIGAAGSAVGIVGLSVGALVSLGFALGVLLLLWSAAWLAFTGAGVLLDPALATLAIGATFAAASTVRHVGSEGRQRWVRAAFSRYISPNLVNYLMRNPGSLELGGRRQECSFVFTDLAGFTSMMERLDPADAVALLNGYLDGMIAIIFAHGGTLDRIVGDAVAAMFSAPVPQPDHRQRAVQCAMAMQRFSAEYVARLGAKGIAFGRTRIGVHTGFVIVGNFGGSAMFDYRALGDVVNTAARLEEANKYFGTWMCVSAESLTQDSAVVARPIGRLLLRGKTVPLKVYELIDPSAATPDDPAYQSAYELMEASDERAVAAFATLLAARPDDALVRLHVLRLQLDGPECDDLITLDER